MSAEVQASSLRVDHEGIASTSLEAAQWRADRDADQRLPTPPAGYWVTHHMSKRLTATELVDSDNTEHVVVEWTPAEHGAQEQARARATQRLLNGLVYDNPGGDPANNTFYGVPAGNHAALLFRRHSAEFQDSDYTVIGQNRRRSTCL